MFVLGALQKALSPSPRFLEEIHLPPAAMLPLVNVQERRRQKQNHQEPQGQGHVVVVGDVHPAVR